MTIIKISQGALRLSGAGPLAVRPRDYPPSITGSVVFDEPTTVAQIDSLTEASISCTDSRGKVTSFAGAFCMGGTTPGRNRNEYQVAFQAMSATG